MKKALREMKDELIYFKQELFNIPKGKEAEFKAKYADYQGKIADYELQAKKLDMLIRNDEVGLLMLEQGIDK